MWRVARVPSARMEVLSAGGALRQVVSGEQDKDPRDLLAEVRPEVSNIPGEDVRRGCKQGGKFARVKQREWKKAAPPFFD
jgi:hypothetical protein